MLQRPLNRTGFNDMAHFVLVHGAWQGAWVWETVTAGLRMHGHAVTVVELPGSGSDSTPAQEVSLQSYAERISQAVLNAPGPVHLVGHSMGGVAISAAAETAYGNIARLIYLCAFLPVDGDSLMGLTGLLPSEHPAPLQVDDQQLTARFDPAAVPVAFLHDADQPVATWAAPQFKPQALAPLATPVHLSAEAYGRVPRDYIVCLQDRAIAPPLQRLMIERAGCETVHELDAGHCPFLSMPWEVVQLLNRIAH